MTAPLSNTGPTRGAVMGRRLWARLVALVVFLATGVAVGAALTSRGSGSDSPRRRVVGHPARGVAALVDSNSPSTDIFNGQFCGAALIRPRVAITAAHCLFDRDITSLDVVADADNLCRGSPIDGERRHVVAAVPDPRFSPSTYTHDVAVLELASSVSIRPLPMATSTPGPRWSASHTAGAARRWAESPPADCRKSASRPKEATHARKSWPDRPESSTRQCCARPRRQGGQTRARATVEVHWWLMGRLWDW
jgi:hypothetical protein